jgi:hypothetical protein
MAGKTTPPALGEQSFSCPHCGALAHQNWYRALGDQFEKDHRPSMPDAGLIDRIAAHEDLLPEHKADWINEIKRQLAKEVFWSDTGQGVYVKLLLMNVTVSECFSCNQLAIWRADNLIYPAQTVQFEPHEDMPAEVRCDFLEAASVVNSSPRGAAALLRLAIQNLMKTLRQPGRNLNDDIGALVRKGNLDPKVQPRKLYRRNQISAPKRVDEIYNKLPPHAITTIEKRDTKAS